jgi:molecular chaperone HtpG
VQNGLISRRLADHAGGWAVEFRGIAKSHHGAGDGDGAVRAGGRHRGRPCAALAFAAMTSSQRFQVNLAGIIDLLSAHLYSGPEVYVRELLQNGVDALTARAALTGKGDPAWGVRVRSIVVDGARVLEVDDDGVGLTDDEMERFLSTIGESSKRGDDGFAAARAELLGQFGIGLLSCFMISDEVVVTSRSARTPNAPVTRWIGKSDGTYRVERAVDEQRAPGTTVHLAPKKTMREWVEPERVRELVSKFGSLLPWPIHVDDGLRDARINTDAPPWLKDAGDRDRARALLRFGENVLGGERPLDAILLHSEAGVL